MNVEQNEQASKFLLGKLSEAEQTKIEEAYFKNNALFEDVRIAENDLIDAYVAGSLSPEDRRRFENRLLLNPQQRQRVKFAKTLFRYAAKQSICTQESKLPPKMKWWTFLSQILSVKPMFSLAFAATTLILLSVGVWWALNNSLRNSAPTNQPNELARVETPAAMHDSQQTPESTNEINDAAHVATVKTPSIQPPSKSTRQTSPKESISKPERTRAIISTIVLTLGATRAAETAKMVEIPAKADLVRLQLKFEEGDFASYSAVLTTVEGKKIWSGRTPKSTNGANEKTVIAMIPARLLKNGDYIISLKGSTEKGSSEGVGDYSFTVHRNNPQKRER